MQNIIWGGRVFFIDKTGYSDYVSMARGYLFKTSAEVFSIATCEKVNYLV